jgi:hypothetical protein
LVISGKEGLLAEPDSSRSMVARLAPFFPEATAIGLAVRWFRGAGQGFPEPTVIEFGTRRDVLFASALPFEFAETLRLENDDGSLLLKPPSGGALSKRADCRGRPL